MGNCVNCLDQNKTDQPQTQLDQPSQTQLDHKLDQKTQLDHKLDQKTQLDHSDQNKPITYIERKMSNHYTIRYPTHDTRTISAVFRKTRNLLIKTNGIKCFICQNSETLEVHHFYCEKYATNAIDWDKFALFAATTYNIQTGTRLDHDINWELVKINPDLFVDSINNMVVLCKSHHTSGKFGIHHVPFPDWILQRFAKSEFKFLV